MPAPSDPVVNKLSQHPNALLVYAAMWWNGTIAGSLSRGAGVAVPGETKHPLINTSHQDRHPHLIMNFFANSNMNKCSVHRWDSEAINSGAFV